MTYEPPVGWLGRFIVESNRIEGIHHTGAEDLAAHETFLARPMIKPADLSIFVSTIAPGERLRTVYGMGVTVGDHVAPAGGPTIVHLLNNITTNLRNRSPYENHVLYEDLHPFTDGNGRSGRVLWLWQMINHGSKLDGRRARELLFFHTMYYQSLRGSRFPRIQRPWAPQGDTE